MATASTSVILKRRSKAIVTSIRNKKKRWNQDSPKRVVDDGQRQIDVVRHPIDPAVTVSITLSSMYEKKDRNRNRNRGVEKKKTHIPSTTVST